MTYDAVVAIVIQFAGPGERPAIFGGMKKGTRPGGLVLLQGYRPEHISNGVGGPPNVAHMYTEDLLRWCFLGWEIEHLVVHDSPINEGPGHRGMSALIDLDRPGRGAGRAHDHQQLPRCCCPLKA